MLTHMRVATRKQVKKLIRAERIFVNGLPAHDPGMYVNPETDTVEVDGEVIAYREHLYLMLNKPQGVLSATEDASQRTVLDLIEPELRMFQPFPVGRLDKDTEGLLLLTTDGKLAHQLISPNRHVPKRYFARVEGRVTEADGQAFAAGVVLDDGYKTMPGELTILTQGPESEVELTIYEGKFHQVKRMFAAVGKRVVYLKRLAMGPLELDASLAPGEYRELSRTELALLRQAGERN
ncbi:pseudouridine synthase [Alicyclobacillus herbarius]|uniref:pseudouridine synthase n=1 Tax=Alicyclobacillus herbarius TaxID=122960 RepID=UPI000554B896|nr:pseudouridine synthase [Alicyclobacillus herbarius]